MPAFSQKITSENDSWSVSSFVVGELVGEHEGLRVIVGLLGKPFHVIYQEIHP